MFVTSQGSAYSQFRRALDRRNLLVAWSLAAEIPKVALADALALLLLALDEQPWRFEWRRLAGMGGYALRRD